MILYALFFTPCAISSICSSCFVYPRISQNSEIGTPDTLALDHATISESPCSPMIHACTDLASTCKCSPSRYFNLAESKVVPEPKTLFSGNKKVEVKEVGQSTEEAEEITKTIDGPKKKLSKKTLIKTWLLTTSTEACYNYERLQALGIANLMITPIRALYDKVEDQVAELKKYLVFYNSEVFTIGPIINGITCSMEEARANGENVTAKDINSVRTGLMGPVAGIGDTVMQGILFPILFGIGCSMALDGSYLGPIFATVVFEVLIFACGYFMFMTGYKQGKTSLLKILKDGTVDKIINSFSIV